MQAARIFILRGTFPQLCLNIFGLKCSQKRPFVFHLCGKVLFIFRTSFVIFLAAKAKEHRTMARGKML